ncbi:MAG TPA: aldehyde dehydrogenase family protein [Candidatus Obscuribacterales bacterium]
MIPESFQAVGPEAQGQALLLIDVQQDYLNRPWLQPPAAELSERLALLLDGCRTLGLPILHSRTLIRPDGSNRMPHRKEADDWVCVAGSPGSLAPVALAEGLSEPVLDKPFFSAFGNPELHSRLQAAGIDTLLVAGVYTHACIQASVLDAYQLGYKVWLISDAIASDEPLHASLSLNWLTRRACECLSTAQVLQRLGARPAETVSRGEAYCVGMSGGAWFAAQGQEYWIQRNPSDWHEVLGSVPLGEARDVARAAEGAAARQPDWAQTPVGERVGLLRAWAEAIESRQAEFAALLAREIGKPLNDGLAEVRYGLSLLRASAQHAEAESEEFLAEGIRVRHCPRGTIGLISPWNNPLAIPLGKIAPALAFGNTLVWKPALQAPAVVSLLMQTLRQAGIPADCLNLVLGDARTARCLLELPQIVAISFTGSIAAGRQLAGLCAAQGKYFQAELGGNNGVLVGASADVPGLARDLATAVYSFAGQRCTAPRRLILAREVATEFTEAFCAAAASLRTGPPADASVQLGPLISPSRQAFMAEWVAESLAAGGQLLLGGRVSPGPGCWFEATVIGGLGSDARAVREESFGPLALLLTANDFKQALALCNAVEHGLCASLYSNDETEQQQFLARAQAGILRINQPQGIFAADAPFGGWKASGLGTPEHGRWDREFYTIPQVIYA